MHWHASYPITAQRRYELDRYYSACRVLFGGALGDPMWFQTPLKYPVFAWVWNKASRRYHWREGGMRDGKKYRKGAFHPVPLTERRNYNRRLAEKRRLQQATVRGGRLKKR